MGIRVRTGGHAARPAIRIREHAVAVQPGPDASLADGVAPAPAGPTSIVAVVVTKRPWLAEHIAMKLAWQNLRPSAVIVCSALRSYDVGPIATALPGVHVELIDGGSRILGDLRNLAMQTAADRGGAHSLLCTVDDDDLYGPNYMAGMADAWMRHPEAMIVGRATFRWHTTTELPTEPPSADPDARTGIVTGVSGATISIPASTWIRRPDFRYPGVHIGEDVALQARAFVHRAIVGAYFGDFMAIRYADPAHGHTSPAPQETPRLLRPEEIGTASRIRLGPTGRR
jgi:hypothetical protein